MSRIFAALRDNVVADDDLVVEARAGDRAATELLFARYTGFVRLKARNYYLVGADVEDLVQEGNIGLYKAVRDFQAGRQVSFRAFAELCIVRQIITAIKAATRRKHAALNSYVSINPAEDDPNTFSLSAETNLSFATDDDPADEVIRNEDHATYRAMLVELLSGLEVEVLDLYLEGQTYQEIAGNLGRQTKSVDNALQRIKRKVADRLDETPLEMGPPPAACA